MAGNVHFITVSDDEAGQRLDNYLIARLKGVPKSVIYRVIRKGEVRINKGRAKPERKLEAGDLVRVPPVYQMGKKPVGVPGSSLIRLIEASILSDSKDLMVINKPAGLAVHGGSGVSLGLIEALRHIFGEQQYLELVHRLDRETSGCILVAKKRSVLRFLQEQFRQDKQINKIYLALVKGRWANRRQIIDAPLAKNHLQSGERIVRVNPEGKASKTVFEVVEYLGDTATLMQVRPVTGRTHQIRVHAQSVGHPLAADEKYGDDNFNREIKESGIKRLFLHAASLEFKIMDGSIQKSEAPLPQDLAIPLDVLRK